MKVFDKYKEFGAYHWEDIKKDNFKDLISRSVPTLTKYDKIIDAVPKRDCKIVDVGCGDGALTYLLSRNEHIVEVIGCDTDSTGIMLAREKVKKLVNRDKIQFINKSFEECQFPSQSIDVIVMCDVIEHIEKMETLLKKIKQVGKDGGMFINTTPLKRSNGILWDEHHVLEYTKETLLELLSRHFPKTIVYKFSPTFLFKRYGNFKKIYNILYLLGLNPLRLNLRGVNHTMLFSVSYF